MCVCNGRTGVDAADNRETWLTLGTWLWKTAEEVTIFIFILFVYIFTGKVMSFAQVKRYIMRAPFPSQSSCHLECLSRGNQGTRFEGGAAHFQKSFMCIEASTHVFSFPTFYIQCCVPCFSLKTVPLNDHALRGHRNLHCSSWLHSRGSDFNQV